MIGLWGIPGTADMPLSGMGDRVLLGNLPVYHSWEGGLGGALGTRIPVKIPEGSFGGGLLNMGKWDWGGKRDRGDKGSKGGWGGTNRDGRILGGTSTFPLNPCPVQ